MREEIHIPGSLGIQADERTSCRELLQLELHEEERERKEMMDIRTKTVLIIKRGDEYLVGTICFSTDLRWSKSKYDAWTTRRREDAERVASVVGGTVMLFNPIVNQEREARFA